MLKKVRHIYDFLVYNLSRVLRMHFRTNWLILYTLTYATNMNKE